MKSRKKENSEPDDKEQSDRFVETARKLESDESGSAFNEAMNNITKPKRKRPKKKQ